jgi:hypothetical protein
VGLAIAEFRAASFCAVPQATLANIDDRLRWIADQFADMQSENAQIARDLIWVEENHGDGPSEQAVRELKELQARAEELSDASIRLADEAETLKSQRAALVAGTAGAGIEPAGGDWRELLKNIGVAMAAIGGLMALFL